MRKKTLLFVSLSCLIIFLCFTACGSNASRTPSEKQMVNDINNNHSFLEWMTVDSVTVTRKQTNESEKAFLADVEFSGSDKYAEYSGSVRLHYNLYDGGNWMLDEFSDLDYDYRCTHTSDVDDITQSLMLNSDLWFKNIVIQNEGKTGSIDNLLVQNVELASDRKNAEYVTVRWSSKLFFAYAEYTTSVLFTYFQGAWTFEDIVHSSADRTEIVGLTNAVFLSVPVSRGYSIQIDEISPEKVVFTDWDGNQYSYIGRYSNDKDLLNGYELVYDAKNAPLFWTNRAFDELVFCDYSTTTDNPSIYLETDEGDITTITKLRFYLPNK